MITKKYEGNVTTANLNPLYNALIHDPKEEFLFNPRTSSLLPPPPVVDGTAIILVDNVWETVIDKIGQNYYLPNGSKHYIDKYGIDIPDGAIQEDPPSEYHDTHDGSVWILNQDRKNADNIEQAISDKMRVLSIKALKEEGKIDPDFKEPIIKDVKTK